MAGGGVDEEIAATGDAAVDDISDDQAKLVRGGTEQAALLSGAGIDGSGDLSSSGGSNSQQPMLGKSFDEVVFMPRKDS